MGVIKAPNKSPVEFDSGPSTGVEGIGSGVAEADGGNLGVRGSPIRGVDGILVSGYVGVGGTSAVAAAAAAAGDAGLAAGVSLPTTK